ncbi:MAG: hypothetical protein JNM30_14045 [Rhodospirillales bacterium]|nr:hypothetical protein [Rhodospirillales bacterium]
MTARPLSEADVKWLKDYAAEVEHVFGADFSEAEGRFADAQKLIGRFRSSIQGVLDNGRSKFHAVDEAHNELCIASALLANRNPRFVSLEYEPVLSGTGQSIDFRATTDDGTIVYVEVKTIKPAARDRWDQFERVRKQGLFPLNVEVAIQKEWLGGELWHSMFAARSRMLEYALELEGKISAAGLTGEKTIIILALCGEGFHWHQDELEDLVSYCREGKHRPDDPFSKMELNYIAENSVALQRTLSRFACMRRPQGEIRPKRVNWNVQAPALPAF